MYNYNEIETKMRPENINFLLDILKWDELKFDDQTNSIMENWDKYGINNQKELKTGQVVNIRGFENIDEKQFKVICDDELSFVTTFKKEKCYFDMLNGTKIENLREWLFNEDNSYFKEIESPIKAIIEVSNREIKGSMMTAFLNDKSDEFMKQVKKSDKVYMAKIKDRNKGGYLAECCGINTFLPGSMASANKLTDFSVLLGKEIPVMIEDFLYESNMFVVSNKKYVSYILPEKIKQLDLNKLQEGKITGVSEFGIFIQFDEIFTGLLHISEMDEKTNELFSDNYFKIDNNISFYVKNIDNPKRLILTQKEKTIEITYEEFQQRYENKQVKGKVIKFHTQFGYFIQINIDDTNFIGLLNPQNLHGIDKLQVGTVLTVFVSKVLPEYKKIYLKI